MTANRFGIWLASILSLAFMSPVHAQPTEAATTLLHIAVKGRDCASKKLWVVIRDDSSTAWTPADPVAGKQCHWTATVPTISTRDTLISLRLDHARTECHKSEAIFPTNADPYGQLDFNCCISKPFRRVTLVPTPSMPVSYMRVVSEEVPGIAKHTDSRRCIEYGTFEEPGTIEYLQYAAEELFLQPGLSKADKKTTALNVNILPEVQKGKSISLTADEIRHRLGIQRLKGYNSAPCLSLTAMELDADYLKRLKLETLRVTGK